MVEKLTFTAEYNVRCDGFNALSFSDGIKARYAIVPLHRGSILFRSRTLSASPCSSSELAKVKRLCRTIEWIPSAPTRISHFELVPSWKWSTIGSEELASRGKLYVTSRFEKCTRVWVRSRFFASTSKKWARCRETIPTYSSISRTWDWVSFKQVFEYEY